MGGPYKRIDVGFGLVAGLQSRNRETTGLHAVLLESRLLGYSRQTREALTPTRFPSLDSRSSF